MAENYLTGRDVYKNDKYLEKLNSLLVPNSTILDVGCGAGIPVDKYFLNRGHKIIGLDISEKQIELAKKNLPTGEFKVEAHGEILKKTYSFLKRNGLLLITMGSSEWVGKEVNFFGGEMSWSHYGKEKIDN